MYPLAHAGIRSGFRGTRNRGHLQKVEPEILLSAIEQVRPKFHGALPKVSVIYRTCIEHGLLERQRVAPNTFRRIIKEYDLLKPKPVVESKQRSAFAKAHKSDTPEPTLTASLSTSKASAWAKLGLLTSSPTTANRGVSTHDPRSLWPRPESVFAR
jgi:hypothetical protein